MVSRVTVDHGIHVAGGHAKEQVRLAQHLERIGTLPVRLSDDTDAKALSLQHAAYHRHAKAGMVHIGIAGHDDDVAAVPAECRHLLPRGRQKFGRAETSCPVFAVTG